MYTYFELSFAENKKWFKNHGLRSEKWLGMHGISFNKCKEGSSSWR